MKISLIITLLVVEFVIMGAFALGSWNTQAKAGLQIHSPIRINSNSDFASQASANGWPGNGSANNPYVISEVGIDASTVGSGIYIGNTTVYFKIVNVVITNAEGNSGTYFWNSGISLYNVTNAFVSDANISGSAGYGIHAEISSLSIKNLTAINNYYGGVYINNTDNVSIDFGEIGNKNTGSGVWVSNSLHVNITNLRINNTYNGIYLSNVSQGYVDNNVIWNCTYDGIVMYQSTNSIIVSGNEINHNKNMGFEIESSSDNEIINNTIWNNSYGIYVNKASDVFRGNTIFDSSSCGLYLRDSSHNVISSGNITNSVYGIYLYGTSSYNRISTNKISQNSQYGVYSYGSTGNLIEGNVISDNVQYGLFSQNAYDWIIKNNTLTRNLLGLYLSGSNISMVANNVSDNSKDGVEFSSSTHVEIVNNVVGKNGASTTYAAGIFIASGRNITISKNEVYNNTKFGIETSKGDNITVENNLVYENNLVGIFLYNSTNCSVMGNKAWGNSYDIELQVGYSNDVRENVLNDSGIGVLIIAAANNSIVNNTMRGHNNGIILEYAGSTGNIIQENKIDMGKYNGIESMLNAMDNEIYENEITNCSNAGIYLISSPYNAVYLNTILNCTYGIEIYNASRTSMYGNYLENITLDVSYGIYVIASENSSIYANHLGNFTYGIYITNAYNSTIYHNNILFNHIQAYDDGNNTWNLPKPIGGNYWSDYTGLDSNGDGFGDTPYSISGGNNKDYFPLMNTYVPEINMSSFLMVGILMIGFAITQIKRK